MMTRIILSIVLLSVTTISFAQKSKACKQKKSCKETNAVFTDRMDTLNYILGADVAKNMQKDFFQVKPEAMLKGMLDGLDQADSLFNDSIKELYIGYLQAEAKKFFEAKQAAESAQLKANNAAYLEKNKKDSLVKVTPSGLQYKVITQTEGPKPIATDKVKVHYEGRLIDGTIFDSSIERGTPIEFPLNGVIKGWTEGVQLMSIGSTYEFTIPYDLAYGEMGNQRIPPYSTLIFIVELIDFTPANE